MDYATAIALTTATVQMVKITVNVPSRYTPLASLLIGMGIGYLSGITGVIELMTIGLGASGLYDLGKQPTKTIISKMK